MKKLFKWLGIIVLAVIIIIIVFITYIKVALPNVGPAEDMTIEKTPARVARGSYLAHSVMICLDCHSHRDPSEYSMPMNYATIGEGGERFDQTMGFPGVYYSANITPSGIGNWTDGEIYRAITTGVRKSGKPIFPVMPYHSYGMADPEDVKSVIAYIRTLEPKENVVPAPSSDFPMNIIINTIPQKANPQKMPAASDSVAMGKYLVTIAACHDCHTPLDKGKFNDALSMAGGRMFPVPGGQVHSANLTQDQETGIGSWTKEMFVSKFASYRDSTNAHRKVNMGDPQTIMPWTMYGTMTDTDLSNIYAYLKTLQPISHKVVKFEAAKQSGQ